MFIRGYKQKAVSEEWRVKPFVKGVLPRYVMPNASWLTLCYLASYHKKFGKKWQVLLDELDPDLEDKEGVFKQWAEWLQAESPAGELPNGWGSSEEEGEKFLTTFEAFMLRKLLRPEKLWASMFEFVK